LANGPRSEETTDFHHEKVAAAPLPLVRRLGFRLEGGPIRDRWSVNGKWPSVMIYGPIAGEER